MTVRVMPITQTFAMLLLTSAASGALGGSFVATVEAQAVTAGAADDAIYAYTDDSGRLVYANRLQDVPARLRQYARRVDQPMAVAAAAAAAAADPSAPLFEWIDKATGRSRADAVLYKYRGRNGRVTYTNLPDSVPAAQRAESKLDLAHVSINSRVGAELDQQLKAEYDKLRESQFCRSAQDALSQPFWRRAWSEHAPLVACGGLILLCLLITPWMVRKVGGAPWARALSLAVPVLGLTGLFGFVVIKSGNSMSQLRERAQPCDPTTWSSAARSEQGLAQHLHLVDRLQNETKVLEQIHAESM